MPRLPLHHPRVQWAIQKAIAKRCEKANRKRVRTELLLSQPRTLRELIDGTGLPPSEVCTALDQMCISGDVERGEDGRYGLVRGAA